MRVIRARFASFFILVLLATLFMELAWADSGRVEFWSESDESNLDIIDHRLWQGLLDQYLIDNHHTAVNRFSYDQVNAESKSQLKLYVEAMQAINPLEYSKQEQKAYWINLYNAITVNLILDKKPLFSIITAGKKLLSKGPWDDPQVVVNNKVLSLNDIEHTILLPIWQDYRIHFAVNCASIGCPNLQTTAYASDNMDQLLNKGAEEFLSHPRGLMLEKNKLELSSIFKWYQNDFGKDQQAMLKTLSKYMPKETALKLESFEGRIKYSYNWLLNSP